MEQQSSSSAASAVLFDSATASRSVALNGAIGTLCLGSTSRMGVLDLIDAIRRYEPPPAATSANHPSPLLMLTTEFDVPADRERRGNAMAGLVGLSRAARQEVPALSVQCVQLSRATLDNLNASEPELAQYGEHSWQAPRLASLPPLITGPMHLHIKPTSRGAIGNLVLRQLRGPEGELPICNAQIQVAAVGLNFRDVLNVLGSIQAIRPTRPRLRWRCPDVDTTTISHLVARTVSLGLHSEVLQAPRELTRGCR